MSARGRWLTVALLLANAGEARAQARVLLQGIVDGEYWSTDSNSNLLSKNGGKPAGLARLHAWTAVELLRGLVAYGMVEGLAGNAAEESELEAEQYGLRYTGSSALVVDVGRIPALIGTFASRRFSNRNPLIGEPDGYPAQYPYGALVSGASGIFDYRAGMVSLPAVHEEYTPPPKEKLRPAFGVGITPVVGVRLGGSFTSGPYLNDTLTASQLAQQSWDSYHQRVTAADLSVSVGYAELFAEYGRSSYEVPRRAERVYGDAYYVEAKYTVTPRLYVAARVGRNNYPFIAPVSPTFWVARNTDFHDEELGVGFRVSVRTLAKASYRQDNWKVDAGNQAFVRPGGKAVAVQLSQTFDVMDWVDRIRARGDL